MAISLKHKFLSAKADSQDASIVRPSNWNDEHNITIDGFSLAGKATAGAGAMSPITLGAGLSFSGNTLTATAGYDKATIDAMFAQKVADTGDVMTGDLTINKSAPGINLFYAGIKNTRMYVDSAANLVFADPGSGIAHMYVTSTGVLITQAMGDVANFIAAQCLAYQKGSVTQSRMAGYVGYSPASSGAGNFENSGYVITAVQRVGGDAYNFGARQPQLFIANVGWFPAFQF